MTAPVEQMSEEDRIFRLKTLSTLSESSLALLRTYSASSEGILLELGGRLGGSTCAIADAVRGQNRRFITVESGGSQLHYPSMPTADEVAGLKKNLTEWGVIDQVEFFEGWFDDFAHRAEQLLAGQKIGLLFVDSDGRAGHFINRIAPYLSENSIIVLGNYTKTLVQESDVELKAKSVHDFAGKALEVGAIELLEMDAMKSTWFARIKSVAKIPTIPFDHESGLAWKSWRAVPGPSDDVDAPRASQAILLEDGREIGPAHSLHEDIRTLGGGHYSHWRGALYFSTSDDTDPNSNGRSYALLVGDAVYPLNNKAVPGVERSAGPISGAMRDKSGRRRIDSPMCDDYLAIMRSTPQNFVPVNFSKRTAAEIEYAADYAVRTGEVALRVLDKANMPRTGTVLELGPGIDFGGALILAKDAERLIVADRFLAPWDDNFHPAVYRAIQQKLSYPVERLDRIIAQRGYGGILTTLQEEAAGLASLPDRSVDLIYSNAVLEHVYPLQAAATEMFRVTRPGGYGSHQVDFRYHRNFDMPLEHLLLSRAEFEALVDMTHAEIGTQLRVNEAAECFRKAGFEVFKVEVNQTASPDYAAEFMRRLRADPESPYRDWDEADLVGISARLSVRRPA